ncbi:PREDICTED: DELLA protein RGL1-like [Nicotiana attenuata]|uniref:Della protein rgl2 n=1 Tax=Nicotiana attenuata TaxID=49451 RepID=A0A1J6IDJ4_NICAT|nr:PREDICTED: DELLA protein RGL1-like [Nicotiana attenuata]OIT02958.1 della protein rgl2 [Nicotiana attenuata]
MDLDLFSSSLGKDQLVEEEEQQQQQDELQLLVDFVSFDDWDFDVVPLQHESNVEKTVQTKKSYEITESKKSMETPLPSALKILKDYDSRFRRSRRSNTKKNIISMQNNKSECIKANGCKLSTDEILRLGAEKFIQSFTISREEAYMFSHPFASSFLGLSEDDTRNMTLIEYLLASAEKVGQKQFDRARKLLHECDKSCSNKGNPIQRLAYYFSRALHDRINWETGIGTSKGIGMKRLAYIEDSLMSLNSSMIAAHQSVPLNQVTQFAGVQAIIDHVAESEKVHIIDLEIGNGMQWIILMQALATNQCESSFKHLKLTALCTKFRHKIEDTCERLMSFAKSLNLPFSFNIVMVEDIMELKQDDFELDNEEVVAIFAQYILMRMLARPDKLDALMRVIKGINPRAMIVIEVEANHNSPVFVDRFVEALFFYGAFFDALEDCMKHDEKNRTATESEHLNQGIRIIVAAEGEERTIRHVKIDVWRMFFARYGMEEVELSKSSLYQANLVLKNFACGSSCTLEMNQNCLLIGWKGTPLSSLSAWTFS